MICMPAEQLLLSRWELSRPRRRFWLDLQPASGPGVESHLVDSSTETMPNSTFRGYVTSSEATKFTFFFFCLVQFYSSMPCHLVFHQLEFNLYRGTTLLCRARASKSGPQAITDNPSIN